MANREQSDAAEETFPGPGPLRTDDTKRGIHPVEQMVDAAIDRIAREQKARDAGLRSAAPNTEPGHALELAPVESPSTGLATSSSARRARGRLRWKGLDVSDEFRSYADRVARGEDLPPFQGKILAEPDPAFPWDPNEQRRAQSRALKQQFGLWAGVALFLGLCVWVLVVQVGNQPDAAQRAAESPLATVVLGNQPETPKLDIAAPAPGAAEAAAPQPDDPTAAQGTTALASLQERTPPPTVPTAAPASAASASAASVSAASAPTSGAPRAAARGSNPSPAATPSPAGVSATTRPVASAAPTTGTSSAGILRTPPGALDTTVPGGRVAGAGSTSSGGAGSGVAASSPASPSAGSTSAPADPKKEPGRGASTMAPLLVETPSF